MWLIKRSLSICYVGMNILIPCTAYVRFANDIPSNNFNDSIVLRCCIYEIASTLLLIHLAPTCHQLTKRLLPTHIPRENNKRHASMATSFLIAPPQRHARCRLTNNSSTLDIQPLSRSIRRSNTSLGDCQYSTHPNHQFTTKQKANGTIP